MNKNHIFHVISNTHWDREWRFPFQTNRQLLVGMIDHTLEILEKEPEYRAFHLDSQSIVLEDYLAIRPEKRDLIRQLVQANRLIIGPWFILPDEFQVGGESLVRNLLLGHRICSEFGAVMKVGYSPFSWGQISQLPQIYREFGMDVVMFYRGINSLDSPKAEFIWEGADGSRVLASRFSTMPRYNFYFYIYRPVLHNEQVGDIEYHWNRGGLPFHFADGELKGEDYNLLQPVDGYYLENLKPAVAAIVKDQVQDFTTPHIWWAEGHDSSGPNIKTVQIVKDCAKLLPQDLVIHSTLAEYASGLNKDVDLEKLKVLKGECRSSQYDRRSGNLYGYTTSARMYLKQMNFTTEKWLQFYAEPFNAIASLLGLDITDRYLELAWHLLLQNSAHDSIGGCSLDEIHEDMRNRYKQSQEIARGVFARACKYLAQKINLASHPAESIHLVALNPNTFQGNEVIEAFIDIPVELDHGNLMMTDNQGDPIPFQLIDTQESEPVLEQMGDRPMYFKMQRYHGYIYLRNIPALGFKTIHVLPIPTSATQTTPLGRVENGKLILENQYLKVVVNSNGTLNILNKQNGTTYSNLAYFYDEGEAGHAWVRQAVAPTLDTKSATPEIEFSINGSLISVCTIRYRLLIPPTLADRDSPTKYTPMPIEVRVILRENSRRVEFQIELNNPAETHRLRLMFPTGKKVDYSYGEGQFDVVARSTIRPVTHDWIEQPMYDYPMHHFVDLSNGRSGAAILVAGLKEYEFLDDREGTLAITLFRAFTYKIQPSSLQDYSQQKGSQCLGMHRYRLAFYPHAGNWEFGEVYKEALAFNNELRLFQIGRATGDLEPDTSFLELMPSNLIFSCLKLAEDKQAKHFILRLYNPTEQMLRGKIQLKFELQQVWQVTLEEKFVKKIPLVDPNKIEIKIPPKKIMTLKMIFM